MSTNYRRGAAFERRVVEALRQRGYSAVRTAGSHGPFDVVGLGLGGVVIVQCKRNGAIPAAEWNALYDVADRSGVVALLAWMPGARGIEFARITGRNDGKRGKQRPMEAWR